MSIVNASWLHHEIIVNDCDVSYCENYKDGKCFIHKDFECEKFPSCHYKKWRKAEEKLDVIDNICTGVLEDYENNSIVMLGLAGKITDVISGVNNNEQQ